MLSNPLIVGKLQDYWRTVADCYEGTERIKDSPKAGEYLPKIPKEIQEETKFGTSDLYKNRKSLAFYENFLRPIIDDAAGIMSKNPPKIRFGVKKDTESSQEVRNIQMWGNRYDDGLPGLKSRLNFAQLLFGRYGMLLDVVADADGLNPQFCVIEYHASKIMDGEVDDAPYNTTRRLRWVKLDESYLKFDYSAKYWKTVERYRVLGLDANGRYYNAVLETDTNAVKWSSFDILHPELEADYLVYPKFKGKELDFIPFTVCNVDRLGVDEYQNPPFLDVAIASINQYRLDSLYKVALGHYASPTLVIEGAQPTKDGSGDSAIRLGEVLKIIGNGQNQPHVSLLETSCAGLSEFRSAKQEIKDSLQNYSIRSLLERAGASSSGEAIKLRTASGTSVIAAIDKTGARAIEEILCYASMWTGVSKEQTGKMISFEADTNYLDNEYKIGEINAFLQQNESSKLLSNRSVYELMTRCCPGVLPSYEDNEAQKELETELNGMQNQPGPGVEQVLNRASQNQAANQQAPDVNQDNTQVQ